MSSKSREAPVAENPYGVPGVPLLDTVSPQNQIIEPKEKQLKSYTKEAIPSSLPAWEGRTDGVHPERQIQSLFGNRHMTTKQISALFSTMDKNKNGEVTDEEYEFFFKNFIQPYQTCDADKDELLNESELLPCLQNHEIFEFLQHIANAETIKEIIPLIDRKTDLTFYDYLFLRRVNIAVGNCGESYTIQPQKLYCALSITAPRAMHMKPSEERLIFEAAIILTDGFYYGQSTYLNTQQFIGVAQIFNYFQDYELRYSDGIVENEDFIRAVQEAQMPQIYNSMVVQKLFIDMDGLDFFGLAQSIWSYRTFLSHTEIGNDFQEPKGQHTGPNVSMSYARFQKVIENLPQRLQRLIKTSAVPSNEAIEKASSQYFGHDQNGEQSYLANYNNLIFLQKSQKKLRHRKSPTQAVIDESIKVTFDTGDKLIFNMFNGDTNNFITLDNFARFVRFSSLYLELDPEIKQRLCFYDVKDTTVKPRNTLSMGKNDLILFDQFLDFMNKNLDFYINYKEFMEWFAFKKTFQQLRNPNNTYHTGQKRLVAGFKLLGLRLSRYNLKQSAEHYDASQNDIVVNAWKSFIIALKEEIVANRDLFRQKVKENVLGA